MLWKHGPLPFTNYRNIYFNSLDMTDWGEFGPPTLFVSSEHARARERWRMLEAIGIICINKEWPLSHPTLYCSHPQLGQFLIPRVVAARLHQSSSVQLYIWEKCGGARDEWRKAKFKALVVYNALESWWAEEKCLFHFFTTSAAQESLVWPH